MVSVCRAGVNIIFEKRKRKIIYQKIRKRQIVSLKIVDNYQSIHNSEPGTVSPVNILISFHLNLGSSKLRFS